MRVLPVRFDKEVWYNGHYRAETVNQIRLAGIAGPCVLVGFSKSALGAINIALENPKLFQAVLIYDAPLALVQVPPWNTADFYSQTQWANDLPINKIPGIRGLLGTVKLRHIGGTAFSPQHDRFDQALGPIPKNYEYFREPFMAHHWDSGWLSKYHNFGVLI